MSTEQAAGGSGRHLTPLSILAIQLGVVIYTGSGICMKMAARPELLSFWGLFWVALCVVDLGVYAIVWQQIIKRFDLSIAYANRAFAIFWSMLWAALLFKEQITPTNLLGVVIIFAGIMLVNKDAGK